METLRVGAAFPDPPFNAMPGDRGLDIDLMAEIAAALGTEVKFVSYDGPDFDGIFDALNSGAYDCVTSGAAVTTARAERAAFLPPYLISGQALAVDTNRLPEVTSIDQLDGLSIGVQRGTVSQSIAEQLVAEGTAGDVRVYDYGRIASAVADLTSGECDVLLKLAPALTEVVKAAPGVEVVQRGIATEDIAIAVSPADQQLFSRISVAQAQLEDDGTLQRIRRMWLGNPYADQRLAFH